jgi:Heterokaryon incompatibility protein (HET)
MRLLDTATLTLHEFIESDIPPYAILSHCWESEEVLFHDIQAGTAPNKKGYSKIRGCCRQASADGFQYAWVDSCCIDKTSSAELSEAINSMYKWYRNSLACYVYLADVTSRDDAKLYYQRNSDFRKSRWFTRGWTLQELLAPIRVTFYDLEWVEMGTKMSLGKLISSITGIKFLFTSQEASIAQKMSWASDRMTTRIEDQAYCLMGLLGVNMPPLYGEGSKAFQRLQLELLKITDDETIFAWGYDKTGYEKYTHAPGLLADSVAAFRESGDIIQSAFDKDRPPFLMTNKGIRMEVLVDSRSLGGHLIVPLNCKNQGKTVCLILEELDGNDYRGPGLRREWKLGSEANTANDSKRTVLYVKQNNSLVQRPSLDLPRQFMIKSDSLLSNGFTIFEALDTNYYQNDQIPWYITTHTLLQDHEQYIYRLAVQEMFHNSGVFLSFSNKDSDVFVILLWRTNYAEGYYDQMTMSIFIPDQPKPFSEMFSVLQQEVQRASDKHENEIVLVDRASRYMKSGKCVSATLRLGVDFGDPLYFLDIEIDVNGRLTWPDLSDYLVMEDRKLYGSNAFQ